MRAELDENFNQPITVLTIIHCKTSQFLISRKMSRKVGPRWMPIMSIILGLASSTTFFFIGKAQKKQLLEFFLGRGERKS